MGRKIRVICRLCGTEVMPGGRTAHLRDKHPEAEGGYRANFDFKEVEGYKRNVKAEKAQKKKVKPKDLKRSEKSAVVPEPVA